MTRYDDWPEDRDFDLKRDCYYDSELKEWIPCGITRVEWMRRRQDDAVDYSSPHE